MKRQKHLHSDEYMKDLNEWMEHQYDPGHWTGGNIPPHIKYLKRPPRLIKLLLGAAIVIFSIIHTYINIKVSLSECLPDLIWFPIGGIIVISNLKELWLERPKNSDNLK